MQSNEQAPRVDDTPRAYKNTLYRSDDRHYNHKNLKVKPGTKEFVILSVLAELLKFKKDLIAQLSASLPTNFRNAA